MTEKKRERDRPHYKTITVDGEEVRPQDAMWVVYDPDETPVKALPSTTVIGDDIARAARRAWYGDTEAILALNNGYRIELVTLKYYIKHVAADLRPED